MTSTDSNAKLSCPMQSTPLILRHRGTEPYDHTWTAMRTFTDTRTDDTPDELWLVEHPPVFTMGFKGRHGEAQTIGDIPIVYSDRGGDMTYHGPGQIVLYTLLDLGRLGIGIKTLVHTLEQVVIDLLAGYAVAAARREGAPGVYVDGRKIAALGLRVRGKRSYHGLSFNVRMDLEPFSRIDPCGYRGMEVVQATDLGVDLAPLAAGETLAAGLARRLGYNEPMMLNPPVESAGHG